MRAAVEVAKDWRTDKYLRRLEAVMVLADNKQTLELTGNGDILESHDGVTGGSRLGVPPCPTKDPANKLISPFLQVWLLQWPSASIFSFSCGCAVVSLPISKFRQVN